MNAVRATNPQVSMKQCLTLFAMVAAAVVVGVVIATSGCGAEIYDATGAASQDEGSACTEVGKCCSADKLVCTGDPDKGVICTCDELWDCSQNPAKCEASRPVPGSGTWTCSWSKTSYSCTATGSKSSPPGGGSEWSCSFDEESSAWTCVRSTVPNPSNGPGGLTGWSCTVDNELKKVECDKTTTSSTSDAGIATKSDTSTPKPKKGQECVPGQKMWCDGALYCSWGVVECQTSGMWKRNSGGEIDCIELSSGARPNTKCACYNFYFNEACCETPDCIVPSGSSGQICGKSAGQLCDYCTAKASECVGTGAKCLVTTSHETYCTRSCSSSNPCPSGYNCQGSYCRPSSGHCY
jgi:hypothetical protein